MSRPQTVPTAFAGLAPLAERLAARDASLARLEDGARPALGAEIRRLRRRIAGFEPAVTLLGQVKAGKTTLVNALCGRPGLLPTDVNPWTSVVTGLHLHRNHRPRAAFRFFDDTEWDALSNRGGRVGELASRAGADEELARVRAQLAAMRDASRARLGARFELLLGQTHDYDRVDPALIERYVCLGDDFETVAGTAPGDPGRYADITKSADLWLPHPSLPIAVCLRDTPGVNDTFLIREQITLSALRGSRLCVVVLSAAQAMSSVDLALLRMISTVKARDVVIFVNRIDELADPARAVPEIEAGLRATLERHDGPREAAILFGSAAWALAALEGGADALPPDSARALLSWADRPGAAALPQDDIGAALWHLSGLPELGDALSGRILTGPGARLESEIAAASAGLRAGHDAARRLSRTVDPVAVDPAGAPRAASGVQVRRVARIDRPGTDPDVSGIVRNGGAGRASAQAVLDGPAARLESGMAPGGRLAPETAIARLDALETSARSVLAQRLAAARDKAEGRIANARAAFLSRATAALLDHVAQADPAETWTYDPAGLRILLRTAHRVFARDTQAAGCAAAQLAADGLTALYAEAFGGSDPVTAPELPDPAPPVVLGRTIALDLQGGWWSRFWRRFRGPRASADAFARLIDEETAPVLEALRREALDPQEVAVTETLDAFLAAQRAILLDLCEPDAPVRRPA